MQEEKQIMKSFLDLNESILDGKGFIRPKSTYKDGVWSEQGWIAYATDYNTRPTSCEHFPQDKGALYWTAYGDTKEEASVCLARKLGIKIANI